MRNFCARSDASAQFSMNEEGEYNKYVDRPTYKRHIWRTLFNQFRAAMISTHTTTTILSKEASRAMRQSSLMRAALITVANYGIEGATVARICEKAGASRGLISHYFNSKEELLIAALGELFADAQQLKEQTAADESKAVLERIISIAQCSFEAPIYSWEMAAAWQAFTNGCRFCPAYLVPIQASTEQFCNTLRPLFVELAVQYTLSLSPADAARNLVILIDGLWNSLATGKDHLTPNDAIKLCDVFIRGLLMKNNNELR